MGRHVRPYPVGSASGPHASHMDGAIPNNMRVPKIPSRQILAANLDRLLEKSKESNTALGKRAKIAQSHIGRMRRQESAATVDMLDDLADAFGLEPWALLTDSEVTRRNAVEMMLGTQAAPAANEPAPMKIAARTRKRRQKKAD